MSRRLRDEAAVLAETCTCSIATSIPSAMVAESRNVETCGRRSACASLWPATVKGANTVSAPARFSFSSASSSLARVTTVSFGSSVLAERITNRSSASVPSAETSPFRPCDSRGSQRLVACQSARNPIMPAFITFSISPRFCLSPANGTPARRRSRDALRPTRP